MMTSRDGCVRFLADREVTREELLVRKKFRPVLVARNILQANPGGSRKALTKAAKNMVKEEENVSRLQSLQSLERQG